MRVIVVDMPESNPEKEEMRRCPSLEEKVEYALEVIDSGYESTTEWNYIRRLNNILTKRYREGTISQSHLRVLKKMQAIIEKYGQLDPRGVEQDATLHTTTQSEEERSS